MFRLLAAVRPVVVLAAFLLALDTGALARAGDWAVRQAQSEQPGCCVAVPATESGAQGLVQHVQELNALVRWAGSWAGVELPPS